MYAYIMYSDSVYFSAHLRFLYLIIPIFPCFIIQLHLIFEADIELLLHYTYLVTLVTTFFEVHF